ncbi:MAG: 2Fe-2S iron-sulfur cluster-binding protein [Planctomycetaceae bacterium]|nr:(2Fe-2S)-binding protein [Planctomycetaceae bacterium]MDG2389125.1 2Fe-2S iron-sulfur cluster-binding protein [Planctomycetaceae bacterium]
MPEVKFVNEKVTVDVPAGSNLRKEARKAGVQVYWGPHKIFHCPGLGMCGSCNVEVTKGEENLKKPGLWERLSIMLFRPDLFLARETEKKNSLRLSCQTKVTGNCEIKTHPDVNMNGEKFWG